TVQSDIVYGQGAIDGGAGTQDLLLDLYIPDTDPADGPLALMVMIHGGGFTGGSKTSGNLVASAQQYASRGYLVASINYRLGGSDPLPSSAVQPIWDLVQGPGLTAQVKGFVAAIDDTLTAIDFLHQRDDVFAPWTILWGSSAGAITSLNVAYILDDFGIEGPRIAAVIDLWGGFYATPDGPPFEGPNEPPLFIVHGTADPTVPYALTENIVNWQAQVGNPVEVHAIVGAGHGVNMFTNEASPGVSLYQRSVDFLDEQLFAPLDAYVN
ncbi:MAG: alpha/beta hydrolase, partial [Acidimicrobiales bacterium]|nr:alpha/beta hydrolase [Acidimicrobiales bacterium]